MLIQLLAPLAHGPLVEGGPAHLPHGGRDAEPFRQGFLGKEQHGHALRHEVGM